MQIHVEFRVETNECFMASLKLGNTNTQVQRDDTNVQPLKLDACG
jgi:hypothetical protein